MRSRDELEAAFRATDYVVMLPDGELTLRVDRYDSDAERRIVAATGMRRGWDLLTPCNPGAENVSAQANARLLGKFHRELRDWGGAWHASLNRAGSPEGPDEPGAILVDADAKWVRMLAEQFRQVAWLRAALGVAPQLAWT
jgi:hypothetical protein